MCRPPYSDAHPVSTSVFFSEITNPFSFARSSLVAGVRASLSGLQCTR